MKKTSLALGIVCVLVSCTNQPKQEETAKAHSPIDSLMEQVMHGHDEGMGRIGRVEKAAQEISHLIDSLQQHKGSQEAITALKKTKNDLDLADSSMNKWMETFDMEMQGMDSIAKVKYLTEQEKWVSGIADSLKTALGNAESVLKKK